MNLDQIGTPQFGGNSFQMKGGKLLKLNQQHQFHNTAFSKQLLLLVICGKQYLCYI